MIVDNNDCWQRLLTGFPRVRRNAEKVVVARAQSLSLSIPLFSVTFLLLLTVTLMGRRNSMWFDEHSGTDCCCFFFFFHFSILISPLSLSLSSYYDTTPSCLSVLWNFLPSSFLILLLSRSGRGIKNVRCRKSETLEMNAVAVVAQSFFYFPQKQVSRDSS